MPSTIPKVITRETAKEDKFCNICGKQIYKKEEFIKDLNEWIVTFDNRYVCDNSVCLDSWNKKAGDDCHPGYANVF